MKCFLLLGPIISILIICSFIGTYSQSQQMMSISDTSSDLIKKQVEIVNEKVGQNVSYTVITPIVSQFGYNNFQLRAIPFMLLYNKKLLDNRIYIINEWVPYPYQPIIINKEFLEQTNIQRLYWETKYYPIIILRSDRQMVPINQNNERFWNGISKDEVKFIIDGNNEIVSQLKAGSIIKFSIGDIREITKILPFNDKLEIYTNGSALNPVKDGFPNLVEWIN